MQYIFRRQQMRAQPVIVVNQQRWRMIYRPIEPADHLCCHSGAMWDRVRSTGQCCAESRIRKISLAAEPGGVSSFPQERRGYVRRTLAGPFSSGSVRNRTNNPAPADRAELKEAPVFKAGIGGISSEPLERHHIGLRAIATAKCGMKLVRSSSLSKRVSSGLPSGMLVRMSLSAR